MGSERWGMQYNPFPTQDASAQAVAGRNQKRFQMQERYMQAQADAETASNGWFVEGHKPPKTARLDIVTHAQAQAEHRLNSSDPVPGPSYPTAHGTAPNGQTPQTITSVSVSLMERLQKQKEERQKEAERRQLESQMMAQKAQADWQTHSQAPRQDYSHPQDMHVNSGSNPPPPPPEQAAAAVAVPTSAQMVAAPTAKEDVRSDPILIQWLQSEDSGHHAWATYYMENPQEWLDYKATHAPPATQQANTTNHQQAHHQQAQVHGQQGYAQQPQAPQATPNMSVAPNNATQSQSQYQSQVYFGSWPNAGQQAPINAPMSQPQQNAPSAAPHAGSAQYGPPAGSYSGVQSNPGAGPQGTMQQAPAPHPHDMRSAAPAPQGNRMPVSGYDHAGGGSGAGWGAPVQSSQAGPAPVPAAAYPGQHGQWNPGQNWQLPAQVSHQHAPQNAPQNPPGGYWQAAAGPGAPPGGHAHNPASAPSVPSQAPPHPAAAMQQSMPPMGQGYSGHGSQPNASYSNVAPSQQQPPSNSHQLGGGPADQYASWPGARPPYSGDPQPGPAHGQAPPSRAPPANPGYAPMQSGGPPGQANMYSPPQHGQPAPSGPPMASRPPVSYSADAQRPGPVMDYSTPGRAPEVGQMGPSPGMWSSQDQQAPKPMGGYNAPQHGTPVGPPGNAGGALHFQRDSYGAGPPSQAHNASGGASYPGGMEDQNASRGPMLHPHQNADSMPMTASRGFAPPAAHVKHDEAPPMDAFQAGGAGNPPMMAAQGAVQPVMTRPPGGPMPTGPGPDAGPGLPGPPVPPGAHAAVQPRGYGGVRGGQQAGPPLLNNPPAPPRTVTRVPAPPIGAPPSAAPAPGPVYGAASQGQPRPPPSAAPPRPPGPAGPGVNGPGPYPRGFPPSPRVRSEPQHVQFADPAPQMPSGAFVRSAGRVVKDVDPPPMGPGGGPQVASGPWGPSPGDGVRPPRALVPLEPAPAMRPRGNGPSGVLAAGPQHGEPMMIRSATMPGGGMPAARGMIAGNVVRGPFPPMGPRGPMMHAGRPGPGLMRPDFIGPPHGPMPVPFADALVGPPPVMGPMPPRFRPGGRGGRF